MKQLAGLQRAFQRHVHRPGLAMERDVLSTPRASAARRLAIYADGYRSRLVEALGNDYPALRALLGADRFDRMMLDFIAARPSRHANLRWYGGGLARFLARSPRWRNLPSLRELAEFEWALGLAFDAADAPVLAASALANLRSRDWPAMRFGLHPSVQRLSLRGNAPRMWQGLCGKARKVPPAFQRDPVTWLVWRRQFEPFFRPLATDEAWALAAVARGRGFGVICSGLRRFAGDSGAALRGAQLLRNWLTEGLICELSANR